MKLICPSCGAVCSADAWNNDPLARQCLLLVAEMPTEVSRRSLAYLALFRPHGGRGLAWSKSLRLLNELRALVIDSYIQWDNRPARPNNVTAWSGAMEQIIANPPKRLPLTNHNYLRAIAYDLADEADRQAEVRRNAAERSGSLRTSLSTDNTELQPLMTMEQMRAIREENMGKRRGKS